MTLEEIQKLCKLIRYDIVTSTTEAGSGHPTSSLSAVELMTTLFFGREYFKYNPSVPKYNLNDRIIFSKGHASPLLYSLYHVAGWIDTKELMTLRKNNSRLEGHPTPRLPWVDVATGSLGQGLSVAIGMSLTMNLNSKRAPIKPNIYVLLGDSEMAEGQNWEAMEIASHYNLGNIIGILDVNRLGQRGPTMLGWDLSTYQHRINAFGWQTIVIEDGHNIREITRAFDTIKNRKNPLRPVMIIAKTIKGKGISMLENKEGWHGKVIPKDKLKEALKDLGKIDLKIRGVVAQPEIVENQSKILEQNISKLDQITDRLAQLAKLKEGSVSSFSLKWDPRAMPDSQSVKNQHLHPLKRINIDYKKGALISTREAYGHALAELGKQNSNIVALDAEVSNSTFAKSFQEKFPHRFFEMFIAEQNMVSTAAGMSKLGVIPFTSTFSAFLTRAFDQIRMAELSEASIKVVGSHAGVAIGQDGSSQMGLQDIAMFRSLLNSIILYPSDAISTARLVEKMLTTTGISYLRTTREASPIIYNIHDEFEIGGSKIIHQSAHDKAIVIGAGVTLHEALKAYQTLKKQFIPITVVDLYSIRPIDETTLKILASKKIPFIVVEDHYAGGGIGEAVRSALSHERALIYRLCVQKLPHSASPEELLRFEEIDAKAIVEKVKAIV